MGEHSDSQARPLRNVGAQAQESRTWVRPPDKPDMAPVSQLAIAYPFLTAMWFVCVMSASPGYEFLGSLIFLMIGPIFFMGAGVALGLPLRLNRRLSRWWLGNAPMYILLLAAGVALIVFGFNTPIRQVVETDGHHYNAVTPHGGLIMGGCFIITFLAVNAAFPLRLKKRTSHGSLAP